MKYYLSLLLLVFAGSQLSAQNTIKMSAVKANDYGVSYSLPKTSVVVTVNYTKTTRKAGEYYQYAERYLNISNPIAESEVLYSLDKIEATTKGVVDKDKSYLVEFKTGSASAYATLTKDGMLCAINDDYTFPQGDSKQKNAQSQADQLPGPRTFLSEEILRAGSSAKQAELIAKQIYRLRESRTNILTGDADNMPPDGNAMKLVMDQLDSQEKVLTAMFLGTEQVELGTKEFVIIPDKKDIDKKVVFRFSSKLGVVEANDLAGAPIYFSLINRNPVTPPMLTPKEEKAIEEKFSKGIVYNIPGKADLQVSYNGKNLVQQECDVVQYGTQEVLVSKLFETNKKPIKVVFYPDLGAIKQIIE